MNLIQKSLRGGAAHLRHWLSPKARPIDERTSGGRWLIVLMCCLALGAGLGGWRALGAAGHSPWQALRKAATVPVSPAAPLVADGPVCSNFTNKTTANGLGSDTVFGVYVVGSTVYAATAGGLSISTDGGATFTNRTTANGLGNNTLQDVYVVGSTVYAATQGGLSISTDGGASFTNRTTANGLGSNVTRGVSVAGSTVYVATFSGLSISTNGGTSFTNKTTANGLGSNNLNSVYAVGNTVCATTNGSGLSISTNGGTSFTNKTTANGLGSNYVYGVQAVGSTVYAATYPVSGSTGGLAISTDGGASFTNRTTANGLGDNGTLSVYALGNTVYVGTINGLSISTDGGASFTNYTTANGLGNNNMRGIFATATNIYAGSFGGGLSFCSPPPEINVKGNSTTIAGGSTTPAIADDTDFGSAAANTGAVAHTFTIENTGAGALNLTGTPKVALSGANASDFSVAVQPSSPVAATNGTTTFLVNFAPTATGVRTATVSIANDDSDENPYTFAIQGTGTPAPASGPACSNFTNRGNAHGLGDNSFGNYYVYDVYVVGSTVYAATAGDPFQGGSGGIGISTDGGASFTLRTTANGLGNNFVLGVYVAGSTVYAATNGGLAISTDGGASFTNRTTANGLGAYTVQDVYAVGNVVYAATNGGLSISTDGGASFTNRTTANGLGNNTVLDVYVVGSTVYAATNGGGLSISTDGGASFTNRTTANGLGSDIVSGVYAVGSTVYAAAFGSFGGGGVSISTDGGASFTNRTTANGLGSDIVNGVYALGSTVYAATQGGLSISTDGGASFTNYTTASGLGGSSVNGVFATATKIYAATESGLSFCPPPLPEINVKGNSTTIARGDTTPSTSDDTDFSMANVVGGMVAKTFTIENTGGVALNLTGTPIVALSGTNAADFSVTTQPTSPVAAAGTTTFTITFDPNATGLRTATVSIANDDPNNNPYTFDIQGTGVNPDYAVTTTGNAIVVTDVTGNSDSLITSEPASGQIKFAAAGRFFQIDGGTTITGDSGNLSLAGVTSITINQGNGDDTLHVGAFTANPPSLTINGDAGNDTVNFNGSITFAANANLDVNLQDDTVTPGIDSVAVANSAQLNVSGTGTIDVRASRSVTVSSGGRFQTQNGNLTVQANQQATPTTGSIIGVSISGTIESTGTGVVSVAGKGGDNSAGLQYGVHLPTGGLIRGGSTGTSTVVQGTGGASTGTSNIGIFLPAGAVSSIGGHISVTGIGGGVGASSQSAGIVLQSGGQVTGGTNANVTLDGTRGPTGTSNGIAMVSSGATVSAGGTGNITFISDTIRIDTSGTTINAGSNAFNLRQKTNGVAINLGSGSGPTAGTVEYSDGELDRVTAGTINVGDANSGNITVSANITRAASTILNLTTGGSINLNASALNSAGGNVTFTPGSSGSVNPAATGTDVSMSTTGTLSFTSDADLAIAINGTTVDTQYRQLNVVGLVNLTGVDLVLSGSHTPVIGQTFTIVNNDGTDTITGTFTGLAEGATIPNFLGSNLGARISYVGGDSNDVTLTVVAPAMAVSGFGNPIANGSTTPSTGNDTDFGSTAVSGGTVVKTFTIANTGTAALNLTGDPKVALSGANPTDFSVTAQPTSPVAATNGTTTFTITFDPSATGLRTATVSIANDDPSNNPYTFAIQGTGTAPTMAVSGNGNPIANGSTTPSTANNTDFGSAAANTGANALSFTIANTGTGALNLTGTPKVAFSGTNAADFSVAVQPASPVAATNGTTTFLVNFAPTGTSTRTATVSIANDDPTKNPYTFAIQGTGTPAPANGPACTNFVNRTTTNGLGNNQVNGVFVAGSTIYAGTAGGLSISTDGGFSFSNKTTSDGLGNNTVTDVYVVGSTVYAATNGGLSISTDGGASFNTKTTADGLGNNTVTGVYAVGSTVYAATFGGGLAISTNGGASFNTKTTADGLGSNQVTGVYAVGSMVYAATVGGLSISTDGGASFTNKTTAQGLGDANVRSVIVVGSTVYAATQSGLSISTDGGASFSNKTTTQGLGNNFVNRVYVLGSTVYAATNGGLSISTDGGASFTNYTTTNGLGNNLVRGVYATATSIYAGTLGGLSFCPPTPPVMAVSGNSNAIANGSTTPATTNATDFGATAVSGGAVVNTFTIANTGLAVLNLTGTPNPVVISGTNAADFTVTTQPTSPVAAVNGTATFQITFDPSALGTRTATVSIANDDPTKNPYTFVIQGSGFNSPPMVVPQTPTLPAGSLATPRLLALVSDDLTPATQLLVTINGGTNATVNGVTVSGLTINAAGQLSGNVATTCAATTAMFMLTVTDGNGAPTNATVTVTVTTNTPPTLSYGNQAFPAGGTPSFNPSAGPSDNGSVANIALQSITPATGLSLSVNSTTGQVTVTGASIAQSYTVVIRATDNCGLTADASFTVALPCPTIALAPTTLPNATVNTAYNQSLTATPAGGNYTFAVSSGLLPTGLTLNSNGSFSGAPTQGGTFNFRVTASGFGTCSAFQDYVLLVNCPSISITTTSLPGGTLGTVYNQTLAVSPAGTYNFAVTSGALPTGLTLNAATGAITGTPNTTGSFAFTVTASSSGCAASKSFTVAIACAGISLSPATLPGGQAGIAYSQAITVNPAGSYTFSITQGNLPAGLTLNPQTGLISGTPSVTGTSTVTIKAATANGCESTATYTLTVSCPTVAISPANLPNGQRGEAYSQTLSASPAGGNYVFTVSGGSLPNGLTLNSSTGILSGTPTGNGSSTFTVTATGFGGCAGSRQYTVNIGNGNCPTVSLPNNLPGGGVGQLYSNSVAATPTGTYTYTSSGNLPPGVTLFASFGLLYGFPTANGTYTFTITATDSGNCTGSQSYSVIIGAGSATAINDFSGDRQSDFVLRRATEAQWLILDSATNAAQAIQWGQAGDRAVPGDFDGDGKADLAAFGKDGHWRIKLSGGGTLDKLWGLGSDTPVSGDFDGDGKADLAVWRGAESGWYIQRSSDGQTQTVLWGASYAPYFDVPVPGDYDGDGKTDIAVFRQASGKEGGHWYIRQSSDGAVLDKAWGLGTDVPVAADYDGDGKTDIAVWRGSEGGWYVIQSSDGALKSKFWGAAYGPYFDVPATGDYDGDGKTDFAVWRQSDNRWYILQSSDGATRAIAQGKSGDQPVSALPRN